MNAVADKLREARTLIERGWTQQAPARDENDCVVGALNPSATCWCSLGALAAVGEAFGKARTYLFMAIPQYGIASWNDAPERTQAEVLAAFDKAIELAEREQ